MTHQISLCYSRPFCVVSAPLAVDNSIILYVEWKCIHCLGGCCVRYKFELESYTCPPEIRTSHNAHTQRTLIEKVHASSLHVSLALEMDNHAQADDMQNNDTVRSSHGGIDDSILPFLSEDINETIDEDTDEDSDDDIGWSNSSALYTYYERSRIDYNGLVHPFDDDPPASDQWQDDLETLLSFADALRPVFATTGVNITDTHHAALSQARSQLETLRTASHRRDATAALEAALSEAMSIREERAIYGIPPDFLPEDGREPQWNHEDVQMSMLSESLRRLLQLLGDPVLTTVSRLQDSSQLSSQDRAALQDKLTLSIQTPGESCAICYESIHSPVITRCGHVFGGSCILPWVQSHRNCPMCRKHLRDRTQVFLPASSTDKEESENADN